MTSSSSKSKRTSEPPSSSNKNGDSFNSSPTTSLKAQRSHDDDGQLQPTQQQLQALKLSRNSSTASVDPQPLPPNGWSSSSSHSHHSTSSHQSSFRGALRGVQVAPVLQTQGIACVRVHTNGSIDPCWLTLSQDKFTLYLSSQPLYSKQEPTKKSGWFGFGGGGGSSDTSATGGGNSVSSNNTSKKKQSVRAIDIGAIARIQRGNSNRRFETMFKKHRSESVRSLLSDKSSNDAFTLNPGQCFSIIFRGDWTLDLMMTGGGAGPSGGIGGYLRSPPNKPNLSRSASSPPEKTAPLDNAETCAPLSNSITRDEVLDGLDRVIQTYQRAKRQVSNDVLLLRYIWLDADKDKTDTIKPHELGGVLERINYQMKKTQLADLYDNFSKVIGLERKHRRLGLTFEQTCTLLHKIKRDSWVVKPVNQYWSKLFGELMNNGKPRMTVSDKTFLEKFLHSSQGETQTTLADVHRLFARLNELELPYVSGEGLPKDPRRIDKNRFEAFLLSRENDAFDPSREAFDARSMKRPLSEYWINSSHNTYLTGDQLTSNSSIGMYSNALYRGCKCLELDIWDGGYDDGPVPVVWHGHTMTSKILFKDIIKTIKLYLNFHPDSFPLILSFENHCTLPYQEVMAEELVRILGNALYVPKEESLLGRLPSPWDLRGMVIIKGRRPLNMEIDDYDDSDDDEGAPSTVPSTAFSGTGGGDLAAANQPKVHHRVSPALARLTLLHGTKFRTWDVSVMNPTHFMHSFSESKIRSLCRKSDRRKWLIYGQSHMSRSYPAGSRVDSSNYLPILPWSVGTQMVALNFQTVDASLLLNDGRFRENGGCGYVLKPTSLMELQEPQMGRDPHPPLKLSVRILSGSCLPKPNETRTGDCIDPYVKVSVYDVRNGDKEILTAYTTSVVNANGFFPIWNGEKFAFVVENPAAAMLQLSVYDKKTGVKAAANPNSTDTFVAGAAIPVSCLRRGLRSVKLFDTSNTRSGAFDFCGLLMEVRKNDRPKASSKMTRESSNATPSSKAGASDLAEF